jgi:hypothetical protein
MSLDRHLENYREAYYEADEGFRQVIDEAFRAAYNVFKAHGWPVNNNDPAADLETALVRYAVISIGADLGQQLKPPVAKS